MSICFPALGTSSRSALSSRASPSLAHLELVKRVVRDTAQFGSKPQFKLASILDNNHEAESLLDRVFPVVTCTQAYALRFVASGRFVDNGSYVGCSEDMCASNSRFTFVPAPEPSAGGSKVISLGEETKFGLKSYAWRQRENRFVCEQIARHHYLQSRTWLLADEEWIAVSPFRSLAYARPLRVGDVFVVRSVGQRTNNKKFMTSSRESDNLELRNNPNALSYVVALSDAHGRFLYEP